MRYIFKCETKTRYSPRIPTYRIYNKNSQNNFISLHLFRCLLTIENACLVSANNLKLPRSSPVIGFVILLVFCLINHSYSRQATDLIDHILIIFKVIFIIIFWKRDSAIYGIEFHISSTQNLDEIKKTTYMKGICKFRSAFDLEKTHI